MAEDTRSRPGRPRSEQSRSAVLRATSELINEVGLRAMTTDEIANRAGVSKATIYKLWPNKYAVAVEAFLSEMAKESPDPDTGSAEEDLRRAAGSDPLLPQQKWPSLCPTHRQGGLTWSM